MTVLRLVVGELVDMNEEKKGKTQLLTVICTEREHQALNEVVDQDKKSTTEIRSTYMEQYKSYFLLSGYTLKDVVLISITQPTTEVGLQSVWKMINNTCDDIPMNFEEFKHLTAPQL